METETYAATKDVYRGQNFWTVAAVERSWEPEEPEEEDEGEGGTGKKRAHKLRKRVDACASSAFCNMLELRVDVN